MGTWAAEDDEHRRFKSGLARSRRDAAQRRACAMIPCSCSKYWEGDGHGQFQIVVGDRLCWKVYIVVSWISCSRASAVVYAP